MKPGRPTASVLRLLAICSLALPPLLTTSPGRARAADAYQPPAFPRVRLDCNIGWKFIRQDVPDAQAVGFDDSAWQVVSTPHTYNDVDTFNKLISHGGGQQGAYMGPAWYRRHFTLPAEFRGRRVFLEFEGMRQAGQVFVNGKELGLYENGVTAYGLDVTAAVRFGDGSGDDNILAVRVDNDARYVEKATHTGFEWESKDFNPNYGGINRHVWVHVTGPVHQTLPLYYGLETTGVYVYPSNIDVADRAADVNVESQVANESDERAAAALSAVVVDAQGIARARFDGGPADLVRGEKAVLKASGRLTDARLWSPDAPYLYDVYTLLSVGGKVVDVARVKTGFRKAEFRGGAGKGGVYINDRFTYLTGYSQRSTNEWAGLGQAYPDWMHDLTARLVRDSHANYVRWMHVSPQRVDVDAFDRAGIVQVCPAGDKEKDVQGRAWEQRLEVMRDSMIYFRNSPSILFWEAGNQGISAGHMRQMSDLKARWDPAGGRAIGCRSLTDPDALPAAEYYGVMVGQDPRTNALKTPQDTFRAYSAERRDRAPVIETEDFRDEAARRFWDDFSPPHLGFKPGPNDTYHWTSESFCLAAAARYWAYQSNRISNPDAAHARWSGYASIYFSDSNADGRQDSSEVCRVSGKVDAVRLPKEAYFAYRVMQNPEPDVHIIGHWTYPPGTKKTVYVFSNCDTVELTLNGKYLAKVAQPTDGYVFAFPDVAWAAGKLEAVGIRSGMTVCAHGLETAGEARAVRLTPTVGPGGLRADGQDVALFDVEVVDAAGRRCPTDEGRVDFTLSGPGTWRGGYNSGKLNSTNNLYLDTECGINRVAVRSTLTAGTVTLTASRNGLRPAKADVVSAPIAPAAAAQVAPVAPVAPTTPNAPTTRAAAGALLSGRHTAVSIRGEDFFINGRPTYAGRRWEGRRVEGLLLNARLVQGIFDDLNPETAGRWAYPDTRTWDPDRNTNEFVAAMADWRKHGLLAFTLNLQGGSPEGYSKAQPWRNSAFEPDGSLRPDYLARLGRILDRADELAMVVILGYFYQAQDKVLADEDAVKRATDNATRWLLDRGYRNVLVEVNNECEQHYRNVILRPDRVHELVSRVRGMGRDGFHLPAGTSYGGPLPGEDVVRASDFVLIHGNGVGPAERIAESVRQARRMCGDAPKPILFNEDDHYDFDKPVNHMAVALTEHASWGYFDYRRHAEGFEEGFQSVPVDWKIGSGRKRAFFDLVARVAGEMP